MRGASVRAPVTDLKGIGEKTGKLFGSCGVFTVADLLEYFPRSYDTMEEPVPISELRDGERFAVKGELIRTPALRYAGSYKILTGDISDGESVCHVTWFNQPYLKKSLIPGRSYIFRGFSRKKGAFFVLEQPAIYAPEEYTALCRRLLPRYPLVKGLKNKTVERSVGEALKFSSEMTDPVPSGAAQGLELVPLSMALADIHFPEDEERLMAARRKIAYDEFFLFLAGIKLLDRDRGDNNERGIEMAPSALAGEFTERLSFELTGAQKKVLGEIDSDMSGPRRMHRLIQGDVGSGKTILALLAILRAAENGCQSVLMAPTQVLAAQHYETFTKMVSEYGLPIKPVLLLGTMTAAGRREVLEAIRSGEANCVIGTNAVMRERVEYKRLGLVITDEQHRFGVRQRELLAKKGEGPHILVMSATPIPRTLAMILYGDLDISLLDELPAGRKRIKNAVVDEGYRAKAWRFIADEVKRGRQAYIICPMVERGEDEADGGADNMENAADYAVKLKKALNGVRVGLLHGRMKPAQKDEVMTAFSAGETDVLVSTTVVEVGVNVPNATVMMIENAERFGLAQLHQLRGRVGRGDEQSYCIFVNTSKRPEAAERLEILKSSDDGFKIADEDLRLRGPGDLFGVRQSGEMDFRVADIYSDSDLLRAAASDVDEILRRDPFLKEPENAPLKEALESGGYLDYDTI